MYLQKSKAHNSIIVLFINLKRNLSVIILQVSLENAKMTKTYQPTITYFKWCLPSYSPTHIYLLRFLLQNRTYIPTVNI